MLVVDSSAVLAALVARPPMAQLLDRLNEDPDLHAPHLIDVEILHALRRLVARKSLSEDRAADVLRDFVELSIVRYPHLPLMIRIWELRQNLTAYDATFVGLAELLDAPLLTCDSRLASAPGHDARIELFQD
jgi:predicted nucleic acid-binding protein